MPGKNYFVDAQQALGFLLSQITHVEAEVVKISYPDIQYPMLIPIDTSAPEWTKSVTFFSMDRAGKADWFNHMAKDIPLADVNRTKHEESVYMAAIGYRYDLEELGQAMMIPGMNLPADKAEAARRAYEEFVDLFSLTGDTTKNQTGLLNDESITVVVAQADGTGTSSAWEDKTGDQIARDVNDALTGVYTSTLTVEIADTVLLPVAAFTLIATRRMPDNNNMSILEYIQKYNVYTATTGQPLTIRAVRGLETAGDGNVGRMMVYRRDPRVLKMHIPMTHRFLPVWQTGPITFDIPGIFRLGGLEVRRPASCRYVDGILDAPYE